MDTFEVTAEDLLVMPSDRAEGVSNITVVTQGRATVVIVSAEDGLIAVGASVAPSRRPDPLIGLGLAKRNAMQRLRGLREKGMGQTQ